ncbi:uncharacterized protein LOC110020994 [Phalaenopsis equestris]|uniref:uncharacterized protein LOC110020994 n=1 Tax=Phalaenopsis equestris TaxID=78828 RepID=UPI0009E3874E|nr:uncharacterized protein LOC110020994 [Phalaenopsis equestris]
MVASITSLSKPSIFFCNDSFPYRASTLRSQFSSKPAEILMGYLKLPCWGSFAARRRANLPVYSQFRRPPRRRNSLRKKLITRQEQVRLLPEISNPKSNFEDLGVRDCESDALRLGIDFDSEKESEGAKDSKKFDFSGNSALWDKLDNWVGRYKEDSEFWGIGPGPIFTIIHNSDGNVIRASVNEEEILKRNRIRAWNLEGSGEGEELKDLNSKISIARLIAKEIEVGAYQMPRDSSIARFVVEGKPSSLVGLFHAFSSHRQSLVRIFPRICFMVLCCFCVLGAVRKLFVGYGDVELTREEAEMLRRKKKSRMESEKLQRGSVEVLQNGDELPVIYGTTPQLDRNELMKSITQAKQPRDPLVLSGPSAHLTAEKHDFDEKVREIRAMVKNVHEAEYKNRSLSNHTAEQDELSSIIVDAEFQKGGNNAVDVKDEETIFLKRSQKQPVVTHLTDLEAPDTGFFSGKQEVEKSKADSNSVRGEQTIKRKSTNFTKKKGKAKIITSLTEAKEYLSTKHSIHKGSEQPEQPIHHKGLALPKQSNNSKGISEVIGRCAERSDGNFKRIRETNGTESNIKKNAGFQNGWSNGSTQKDLTFDGAADLNGSLLMGHNAGIIGPSNDFIASKNQNTTFEHIQNKNLESSLEKARGNNDVSHSEYSVRTCVSEHVDPVIVNVPFDALKDEEALNDISSEIIIPASSANSDCQNENLAKTSGKSWTEENFQQFDSVIKKIGHGFKDNYLLAKVKEQENSFSSVDISKLSLWNQDEELEWMKDENLREIVFQVQENELAGRDPFHLMDADDQKAFFRGLELKAERANEKLAGVHEWIHSRIENLDYGADGISLDDPVEKIIPRWKGPPIDQDPEFLKKFANIGNLNDILMKKQENLQKSQNSVNSVGVSPHSPVNDRVILSQNGASTAPKTLIECSDSSNRPGKKTGKEQWQHTKKWSQGFLEVYNSETDPEVKSILKDMGKDLDRWITEKEAKDAADLFTKIPKKKKRFIEKKMNKIKREVEKYGAQAVVSKYKEYADENVEDYLWWLDLQFVLCIELYSVEDDVSRVGFYSLEMAEDLELNPKQFHVIAFEDPGDSKNFCHIVQAQMDLLGNGKAFVVARPPKDAFREAKANGFSVTLIKKGEVKLNVDQTLEEVEEELKEVGSKIYHDKIMNERGVDIRSLVKGVIAADKSRKRS